MYLTSKTTLVLDQYEVNPESRLHFYAKEEEIPLLPQGMWQVSQGLVQFNTFCSNGAEVLLGWASPSMFFGQWLTSLPTYHAKAVSNVYLKWFALREIEATPSLSQAILPQLVRRQRQTEALLAITGQRRVEDRLHRLLLLLKQEMSQPVAEGTRISVRLTHQTIANTICTTRVTVTRLFSKLQDQGWIKFDAGHHIILKDEHFNSVSNW
ncbi:putative transcriptional regulator, Crp/Fnr family [Crinalium epipsammum PCC 9333]|uniref:Putative transcriptional regulator, Crp/Fnr family n=1 Tax=Crinalium epipsammum PCC 9333 TaxID=1173022 RepID=K9W1Q1_9CYAN|nr:Crp/Fnr family transcriptional regulator [Crinalium epipsammum]AFZ13724.1 putative transcriptional regulator, Crp/Fnr family [Crinalium epipsammum PCC 9333]